MHFVSFRYHSCCYGMMPYSCILIQKSHMPRTMRGLTCNRRSSRVSPGSTVDVWGDPGRGGILAMSGEGRSPTDKVSMGFQHVHFPTPGDCEGEGRDPDLHPQVALGAGKRVVLGGEFRRVAGLPLHLHPPRSWYALDSGSILPSFLITFHLCEIRILTGHYNNTFKILAFTVQIYLYNF